MTRILGCRSAAPTPKMRFRRAGENSLGAAQGITVVVTDGIVEFDGAITGEKERKALHVTAENVRGVKGVRDRLVWVEPVSGMVVGAPNDEQAPRTPRRKWRRDIDSNGPAGLQ